MTPAATAQITVCRDCATKIDKGTIRTWDWDHVSLGTRNEKPYSLCSVCYTRPSVWSATGYIY